MRCVGTSAAWECVELTTLHAMPFEAASTPRPSAVVANRVVAACHRERRAGRTPLRLSPSGDPSVLAPLTRSRAQNARHAPVASSVACPHGATHLGTVRVVEVETAARSREVFQAGTRMGGVQATTYGAFGQRTRSTSFASRQTLWALRRRSGHRDALCTAVRTRPKPHRCGDGAGQSAASTQRAHRGCFGVQGFRVTS
jgi:hypothetical protein